MNLQQRFKKAQILRDNQQIDQATDLYLQAREEAQKNGDKILAAECLHMIGVGFYQIDRFDKALDYLKKSKKELENLNSQELLGGVLRDFGLVGFKQKNFDQAKKYLAQSIEVFKKTNNLSNLGMSQVKLGLVLAEEGDLKRGEQEIKEALANLEKGEVRFFESTGYFNLAQTQARMDKKVEAHQSLDKSLEILNQISGEDQFVQRRKEIASLRSQ